MSSLQARLARPREHQIALKVARESTIRAGKHCGLTLRSSRRAAVRWLGAEAPRALQLQVSVWPAREGRARLSERTLDRWCTRCPELSCHPRMATTRNDKPYQACPPQHQW